MIRRTLHLLGGATQPRQHGPQPASYARSWIPNLWELTNVEDHRPRDQAPVAPFIPDFSFVADHPDDDKLQIHYNVIEGPEVGVYVRGTARLHQGRAVVRLPEHFAMVASEHGLTAQLTARSIESRGLAVTSLSRHGLEIAELGDGVGAYDVDYLVHGVRRGREEFAVIRPKRAALSRDVLVGESADLGTEPDLDASA